MDWKEMKETFKIIVLESSGGLISTTKELFNSDSQIRMQLGEEQHLFLQRDGETCFLDYFIDRRKYTKETIGQLLQSIPDRDYEKLTYYCSEHIKQRNRITTKEELLGDLHQLLEIIQSIKRNKTSEQCQDIFSVAIFNDVSAKDILQKNLIIPNYQRPYSWRKENVRCFLHDIALWQTEKDEVNYHAGTIILKERNRINVGSAQYDIIDGQQRLTTLAILLNAIDSSCTLPLLTESESNKKYTTAEVQTLLRAKNEIKSSLEQDSNQKTINSNGNSKPFIELSEVVFSVVVISDTQSEDLAYTFFSNNNSTGKPLTDYDLLKTHHLRYINNNNAANILSKKWHEIEKLGILDDLLQKMLFRLRNWKNWDGFEFESACRNRHDVFNHFKSIDPLRDFIDCTFNQFRFDSLMTGGKDFFTYVDYYGKKYQEFMNLEVIQELDKKLGGYSNGVICAGIKASAFLFFCKFGDIYLKEAVYLLAYRLSELRNEAQIRCDYLGRNKEKSKTFRDIVKALDQSTSEAQFLAQLYDISKRYIRTNTGNGSKYSVVAQYWKALDELMGTLSKDPFVSSVQIPVLVQVTTFNDNEKKELE